MSDHTPSDEEIARMLESAGAGLNVDQAAKARAREAMRAAFVEAVEVDSASAVDGPGARIGDDRMVELPAPEDTTIERDPVAGRPGVGSRRLLLIGIAAAVALVVVGVLAVRQEDRVSVIMPGPTSSTVTTTSAQGPDDTPVDAAAEAEIAEEIAMQFMEARADYDGETVLSLLAPDVSFNTAEIAQSVDEVLLQAEWEQAVGWQYLEPSCSLSAPGRVGCTYTIQGPINERLGLGPYEGNVFLLEISDGRITRVDHQIVAFDFYTDVEVGFNTWVRQNHPDDFAVMNEGDRLMGGDFPSFPHLTPESIQLWERYTAEYLATLD
ncbi:MAG: hypothetical protein OES24_05890 [Acidimicrobiia bacterium]|nr:hypothetical protein [Acidimicrobiia bacterium]